MAEFAFSGIDELEATLQEIVEIPEDVVDEMLNAQADVLIDELQQRGRAYGVSPSEKLLKAIKRGKPKRAKSGNRQVVVAPRGTRTYVTRKGDIRKRTNAEIAFLRNYGTRHLKALPFWSDGVKVADRTMMRAAADVHDRWLRSKGL